MPGVAQARIADGEVAELTNWMLRRFSPSTVPVGFLPYQASEVRDARRDRLADVSGERRRIVAALREQGVDAR